MITRRCWEKGKKKRAYWREGHVLRDRDSVLNFHLLSTSLLDSAFGRQPFPSSSSNSPRNSKLWTKRCPQVAPSHYHSVKPDNRSLILSQWREILALLHPVSTLLGTLVPDHQIHCLRNSLGYHFLNEIAQSITPSPGPSGLTIHTLHLSQNYHRTQSKTIQVLLHKR